MSEYGLDLYILVIGDGKLFEACSIRNCVKQSCVFH